MLLKQTKDTVLQGLVVPAGAVLPAAAQQERTDSLHLLAWQG